MGQIWTLQGFVTHYIFFVMELATRTVQITGITTNPNHLFMMQVARNLTDCVDGFLCSKRYLIPDRDTKYSEALRSLIEREGIAVIRLPPRSPNLNAYAERAVARQVLKVLKPMGIEAALGVPVSPRWPSSQPANRRRSHPGR